MQDRMINCVNIFIAFIAGYLIYLKIEIIQLYFYK